MEKLDAKIMRILYAYYEGHRGDPKMPFADLLADLECDDFDLIHEKLSTLKTVRCLEGTFLEDGQAGLVWLTPDGMSIAKQLLQEEPQQEPPSQTEPDSSPQTAFVSNYDCDVFVSYLLPDEEAEQWQVTTTVTTLKKKIMNSFQAVGQSLVWGEDAVCCPEMLPQLAESAVRIFIVSQRYVQKSAEFVEPDTLFACSQPGQKTVVVAFDEAVAAFGTPAQAVHYALWEHPDRIDWHNLLSDIAMHVCSALRDLREKSKVLARMGAENRGKTVFIDHDVIDATLAESLSGKIETELRPTIFLPDSAATSPSEKNEWFKNNVLLCDGLLVLYGEAQRGWVQAKLLHIGKLLAQRDEPLNAYAVYLGPPEKTNELPVKGITKIDCQQCPTDDEGCRESACDHQLVEQFISALQ